MLNVKTSTPISSLDGTEKLILGNAALDNWSTILVSAFLTYILNNLVPYPRVNHVDLTDNSNIAISLATTNKFQLTATVGVGATRALTLTTEPSPDYNFSLLFVQDSVGGRTINWTGITTIVWMGGATGTPTQDANAKTMFSFMKWGSIYYGMQV